jgi:Flp pilus assembly protein TadB
MLALPVIAGLVIILVYFQLFANPIVILVVFILYVAISLRNKRKFRKQKEKA